MKIIAVLLSILSLSNSLGVHELIEYTRPRPYGASFLPPTEGYTTSHLKFAQPSTLSLRSTNDYTYPSVIVSTSGESDYAGYEPRIIKNTKYYKPTVEPLIYRFQSSNDMTPSRMTSFLPRPPMVY